MKQRRKLYQLVNVPMTGARLAKYPFGVRARGAVVRGAQLWLIETDMAWHQKARVDWEILKFAFLSAPSIAAARAMRKAMEATYRLDGWDGVVEWARGQLAPGVERAVRDKLGDCLVSASTWDEPQPWRGPPGRRGADGELA